MRESYQQTFLCFCLLANETRMRETIIFLTVITSHSREMTIRYSTENTNILKPQCDTNFTNSGTKGYLMLSQQNFYKTSLAFICCT
uniref:Uncharacterized protein n=1 Tax=Rhipicephalus zambeziensis TaxID=60191 RepID=A0A224YBQ8_9ACAR